MSRSQKGSKDPSKEYWTARPGNKHGGEPCKFTKRQTHRAERRLGKPGTTGRVVRRFGQPEADE